MGTCHAISVPSWAMPRGSLSGTGQIAAHSTVVAQWSSSVFHDKLTQTFKSRELCEVQGW